MRTLVRIKTLLVAVHLAMFLLLLLSGRPRDGADASPRSSTDGSTGVKNRSNVVKTDDVAGQLAS